MMSHEISHSQNYSRQAHNSTPQQGEERNCGGLGKFWSTKDCAATERV